MFEALLERLLAQHNALAHLYDGTFKLALNTHYLNKK
jgi:hypothetical protein